MNKNNVLNFYENLLEHNFLPYWSKFVDDEYGGLLNCINNYGDKLICKDKFTWSQGRWLWCLGRIYALKQKGAFSSVSEENLLKWMRGTYDFICNHSIYGDSICCFLLEQDGTKKLDARTKRYDASIYADSFALIGMSQYAKVLKLKEEFPKIEKLYNSIMKRIEENDFLTEPYPIPDGMLTHSITMIVINSVSEYALMKRSLGLNCDNEIKTARKYIDFLMNDLYHEDGYILEYIHSDGSPLRNSILESHATPGHMMESMWFAIDFLQEFGGLDEYLPKIAKTIKVAFNLGWDEKYGGINRYVSINGGKPTGENMGNLIETLVEDTWNMKLWWPQNETLYTLFKLYDLTGDEEFKTLYEKTFTYAFTVFPNHEIGEWEQIRKEDGTAEDKVVALPVKDPFHTLRCFIKIVETCL